MSGGLTPAELDARTPAEAKRHWMIDRLWAGQLFTFVALSFITAFVAFGPWAADRSQERLQWLGCIALGTIFQQICVIWAFSLGGPVGRWKARWADRELEALDDKAVLRDAYDQGAS